MTPSKVHGRRDARTIKPIEMTAADVQHHARLAGVGINISDGFVREMLETYGIATAAMDSNNIGPSPAPLSGLTTPSIAAQIQFLQVWLPGFVRAVSAARNIDDLIGVQTVGSWEDEEIVQGVLEPLGTARPYTDNSSIPYASWNAAYERRTIVRFEMGFEVGRLEEQRAARMRISTAAEKRTSSALALDIQRNRVGFYGYNNGDNRTYGFLNDPALPAYVAVPAGASGTGWADKTYLEITKDLRMALTALRTNSKGVIDPKKTPITLAVATSKVDFLTTTSDFGLSVLNWLNTNYSNVRIESAPELDDANGGVSVFYMWADKVADSGTDDNSTFAQVVPSRFFAVGVGKTAKSFNEDFSNATAGVMVKRPYAVVRYTGI